MPLELNWWIATISLSLIVQIPFWAIYLLGFDEEPARIKAKIIKTDKCNLLYRNYMNTTYKWEKMKRQIGA